MRKCLAVLVALLVVWCAERVSAFSLVYEPENIVMTVPTGGEGQEQVLL